MVACVFAQRARWLGAAVPGPGSKPGDGTGVQGAGLWYGFRGGECSRFFEVGGTEGGGMGRIFAADGLEKGEGWVGVGERAWLSKVLLCSGWCVWETGRMCTKTVINWSEAELMRRN